MGLISRVSSRTYRQKTQLFYQTIMAEFARALQTQNIWFAAQQYKEAEEKLVRQRLGLGAGDATIEAASAPASPVESKASAMISELKKELTNDSNNSIQDVNSMLDRVEKLEKENNEVKAQLQAALARLDQLEADKPAAAAPVAAVCPAKKEEPAKEESEEDDDDDDMDFFDDSDDEDEEAKAAQEALKAKRVAEYNARKAEKAATKGVVAAKSMITLDVKPFDD